MADELLLENIEFSVVHEDVDVAPWQGVIHLVNENSGFTVFNCGTIAIVHPVIQPLKV